MRLVLDAGAFIAVERGDFKTLALIERSRKRGVKIVTVSPVVAQVWRDGRRQVTLARLLAGVDVTAPTDEAAKRAGILLRRTKLSDAVGALVADLCRADDVLLTSDARDLKRLPKRTTPFPRLWRYRSRGLLQVFRSSLAGRPCGVAITAQRFPSRCNNASRLVQ